MSFGMSDVFIDKANVKMTFDFSEADNLIDDITWSYNGKSITNEDIIKCRKACHEALQRLIKKKPDLEGDGYDDSGNLIYDTFICPNCEAHYETDYDIYDHCPRCGQAFDRSDIDFDWSAEDND